MRVCFFSLLNVCLHCRVSPKTLKQISEPPPSMSEKTQYSPILEVVEADWDKSSPFTGPTPYQGSYRVHGTFFCVPCSRSWSSAGSWANKRQLCHDCEDWVLPYKQVRRSHRISSRTHTLRAAPLTAPFARRSSSSIQLGRKCSRKRILCGLSPRVPWTPYIVQDLSETSRDG